MYQTSTYNRPGIKLISFSVQLMTVLIVCSSCLAFQEEENQARANSLDGRRFLQLREDISKLDRQINDLFVNMPIRFPEEQKKHTAKIDELKEQQISMRKELDRAAIESFTADPQSNILAGNHIGQMLIASLEGRAIDRPFDPFRALELTQLLLDKEVDQPKLYFFGYLASFAIEKFSEAEKFLSQYEIVTRSKENSIREGLKKTIANWEKELELRNAETERNDLPRVRITTDAGVIEIELFEDQLPKTVANFISLVDQGFYDGLSFFQVIPGQIARTGCPQHNGTGNPGYFVAKELPTLRRNFFAGTIGMYQDSSGRIGSQFFITYIPSPTLDATYTSFGRVLSGMDVVYRLKMAEINSDRPVTPEIFSKIIKAEVLRKRDHDYQPEKLAAPIDLGTLPGIDPPQSDSRGILNVAPPTIKDRP